MKTIWMICGGMLLSIMMYAQTMSEPQNFHIADSKRRAAEYAYKMAETLHLSQKQMAEVYKLRMELSLALKVIYAQYSNNENKLIETARQARHDFQTGMLKVLDEKQVTLWNNYKRDLIASQQYQDMMNSTATLPAF